LQDNYFLLRSSYLEDDTLKVYNRHGVMVQEEIVRGEDYVLGNRLYIYNNLDSSIFIPIEDGQLVMIQEAMDSLGNWQAIEYFIHSGCGNSYSAINIPPKFFHTTMIAKYCGDFSTKMRVRISLNRTVYVSDEFDGTVNYNQFEVPYLISRFGENLFR
jgi:hypothetical protein